LGIRKWSGAAVGVLALAAASQANARDVVVHAGTLIDGVSETPRHEVSILVRDDRIVSVQSGFQTPAGAEVVDLSKATVLPGFIDVHVHISAKLPSRTNATEDWITHSAIDRAFDGAFYARAMLQQGFTSARDVGGGDETVSVRNAIAGGRIAGPRLWVSLEPLGPTAGHGDPRTGLNPALSNPRAGPDQGARASRPRRRPDQDHALRRHRLHRRRPAPAIDDQ
jgi:imidazolonepropionase-like amidohydrolase